MNITKFSAWVLLFLLLVVPACADSTTTNQDYYDVITALNTIYIDNNCLTTTNETYYNYGSIDDGLEKNLENGWLINLGWSKNRVVAIPFLLNKDGNEVYAFFVTDKTTIMALPSILVPLTADYVDYENKGCITFAAAFTGTPYSYSIALQYSPLFDDADGITIFNDPNEFITAANALCNCVCTLYTEGKNESDINEYLKFDFRISDWVTDKSTDEITLTKGSKGYDVITLQARLNLLGYSVGKADGSYGDKTVDAVIAFQTANNLEATGIADTETQNALFPYDTSGSEDATWTEFGEELSELDTNGNGIIDTDELFE